MTVNPCPTTSLTETADEQTIEYVIGRTPITVIDYTFVEDVSCEYVIDYTYDSDGASFIQRQVSDFLIGTTDESLSGDYDISLTGAISVPITASGAAVNELSDTISFTV